MEEIMAKHKNLFEYSCSEDDCLITDVDHVHVLEGIMTFALAGGFCINLTRSRSLRKLDFVTQYGE